MRITFILTFLLFSACTQKSIAERCIEQVKEDYSSCMNGGVCSDEYRRMAAAELAECAQKIE